MKWTDVITALVALYAATLSTYIFIIDNKSKKRQISIELSNGFPFLGYNLGPLSLIIKIANPGSRPVTINSPRLLLPDKKSVVFLETINNVSFPHELQEGKACEILVEKEKIKQVLKEQGYSGEIKVIGEVSDATGKNYKSKKPFSIIVPVES
ncbi:MAG: hypothetical protein MUF15_28180 [Acidobacteria bacterium]|nr:hypothetical protein [Acidobacteriota bacterium]